MIVSFVIYAVLFKVSLTPTMATFSMVFLKPTDIFLAYLGILVGLIVGNVLIAAMMIERGVAGL